MAIRWKLISMAAVFGISVFCAFAIGHAWQWLVCLALAFSWMGDAFLARYEPLASRVKDPFIAGMGSFAVAQVVYIIAFWKSMMGMPLLRVRTPGAMIGAEMLLVLLPVYLLVGALFWVWSIMRAEQPKPLKIATLVYCVLVSTMAAFAACAAFTGVWIAWPLILGGILFMVSDAFIALHLFGGKLENEKHYEIAVWGTYLPAQILLMLGTSWLY